MRVTATRLNVRSGPGTDFRIVGSLARGALVEAVETWGDWAWVDPAGGWVARSYLESPVLEPPVGLSSLVRTFGAPGSPQCSAGRAQLPAALKLSWSNAEITRFACHVDMEQIFTTTFTELYRLGLWVNLHEFGGCFNDRRIGGSQKRSTHAWGIAVDLNPKTNPQGRAGDMSLGVVKVFEEAGFTWGGRWKGAAQDPMHFQYASGY